jgi:hypothetical protein
MVIQTTPSFPRPPHLIRQQEDMREAQEDVKPGALAVHGLLKGRDVGRHATDPRRNAQEKEEDERG